MIDPPHKFGAKTLTQKWESIIERSIWLDATMPRQTTISSCRSITTTQNDITQHLHRPKIRAFKPPINICITATLASVSVIKEASSAPSTWHRQCDATTQPPQQIPRQNLQAATFFTLLNTVLNNVMMGFLVAAVSNWPFDSLWKWKKIGVFAQIVRDRWRHSAEVSICCIHVITMWHSRTNISFSFPELPYAIVNIRYKNALWSTEGQGDNWVLDGVMSAWCECETLQPTPELPYSLYFASHHNPAHSGIK